MNSTLTVRPAGSYSEDLDVPFKNVAGRGIHVIIDVTDEDLGGGAGAMVVTIQGRDKVSGKKYTLLASASIVAAGTTVLKVFPGSTVTANLAANDLVPEDINININHTNANPMTYSVGAQFGG